jgi:glycosyltransferase involved in cell wall biosynthesis
MKVGIYNRYWTTKGGGEQNAASYASVLSPLHEVELVGIENFDVEQLAVSLGQPSIKDLPLRVIGQHPTAATEASKDYDLWIDHSYLSDDYSLAPLGIYVTMFPQDIDFSVSKRNKSKTSFDFDVIAKEEFADRLVLSTESSIKINCKDKNRLTFISSGAVGIIELVDQKTKNVIDTTPTFVTKSIHTLTLPEGKLIVRFRASQDSGDPIYLDVDCLRLADGTKITNEEVANDKKLIPAFTSSYNLVISISKYTSIWVKNRWGIESQIHYPAVDVRRSEIQVDKKEKIILSVGRFFSEEHGHSKQQLQLVEAFKTMISEGLTGWRLVLLGGCDSNNREYAMAVKKAALSLPIDVVLNADPDTLNNFLERASIYWHATGLGMDLDSNPEKAEHFGIAPVEAMSTGCIPILFGIGGTAELIQEGISGFNFLSRAELIAKTFSIVDADVGTLRNLRQEAITRSELFSRQRFNSEFMTFIEKMLVSDES